MVRSDFFSLSAFTAVMLAAIATSNADLLERTAAALVFVGTTGNRSPCAVLPTNGCANSCGLVSSWIDARMSRCAPPGLSTTDTPLGRRSQMNPFRDEKNLDGIDTPSAVCAATPRFVEDTQRQGRYRGDSGDDCDGECNAYVTSNSPSNVKGISAVLRIWGCVTVITGVTMLVAGLHFWWPVCVVLSLNFWCTVAWVSWSVSAHIGIALTTVAISMRGSVALFPKEMEDEDDTERLILPDAGAGSVQASSTASPRDAVACGGTVTMRQPTKLKWSFGGLTQSSQAFYASSVNKHEYTVGLGNIIATSGIRTLAAAQHSTGTSQGHVLYESFLDGLLGVDEHLLSPLSECVAFDHAELSSAAPSAVPKQLHQFRRGLVVLTNKRLLMLTASAFVTNEVTAIPWRGTVNGKDEGYEIKSTVGDSKVFYPIQISAVKTFLFTMSEDSTATIQVESIVRTQNCCCLLLFPNLKEWFATSPQPRLAKQSKRKIVLKLDLPPWSERAVLTIDAADTIPLETFKGFISQLQSVVETASPIEQQPC
eukprot:m.415724 g.415724  ORF g.415724 m.415724 type:complete len:539 (-) comp29723_c0_seq1:129-1745(-)